MAFTTHRSLLEKVRAGDEISWHEFYATYKPLILLCGRDCLLTPDENDELVQQVMCEIFAKDIIGRFDFDHVPDSVVFKYDPAKGRFRHYLRGIIQHQALRIVRRRPAEAGEAVPPDIAAPDTWETNWNAEWGKLVLQMGLAELRGRVQPETFAAFELYALQERPVEDVAKFLNLSVASVYTAKSRCIAALREIISQLEGI